MLPLSVLYAGTLFARQPSLKQLEQNVEYCAAMV
jgi:hypothetical protein